MKLFIGIIAINHEVYFSLLQGIIGYGDIVDTFYPALLLYSINNIL